MSDAMSDRPSDLRILAPQHLSQSTLLLAFDGWMNGGEVSTGTVERLIDVGEVQALADIDPDPYYVYQMPGPMEIAALFRPPIEIDDGLLKSLEMPRNRFYAYTQANLVLFVGKEPHLRWRQFADCVFELARESGVHRILFVGSFGGSVPHTREPRVHITCSHPHLLKELAPFGACRTHYRGPGSFTTYLLQRAPEEGLEMASLVAEIPGYLDGANPACIEAMTRRLGKILHLPLDLDTLRMASTAWELQVSAAIDDNEELAARVRSLEEEYDNELLNQDPDE